MTGKQRCKMLKAIRQQIAINNHIEYVTDECQYKGECKGTCPKCEEEVRYLERELERRQRMGLAITVAGLALTIGGVAVGAVACGAVEKAAERANRPVAGMVIEETAFDDGEPL